jgi:signal-transduction protein with cAMP-binding, CBS, and nucleotidyltransferase domain
MDWVLGLGTTVALLVAIGYGVNSLLTSRRVRVFPLLRVEEGGPSPALLHVMQGRESAMEETRGDEMIAVEQVMSKRGALKISLQDTAQRAATIMAEHGVCSLLVEEDGKVRGIVTETDIVRKVVAANLSLAATTAGQIMSAPLITIDRMRSVAEADELMSRHNIRHLAVTEQGRVIGILSVRDLLRPIETAEPSAQGA